MKNLDVIKKYVAGDVIGKTKNLHIEDNRLINYSTCLAERLVDADGKVSYLVNETKYSTSTSHIQSLVRNHIPEELIAQELHGVEIGSKFLK